MSETADRPQRSKGGRPYTREETSRIRSEWKGDGVVACPRCGEPFARIPVPPRTDVAYVRDRVQLNCLRCALSVVVERRNRGASVAPRLPLVGWREWVQFPGREIPPVRAKIDTGARTSALFGVDLEPILVAGVPHLRFRVPTERGTTKGGVQVDAPLVDRRAVRSSSGHAERRPVVHLELLIGQVSFLAEVTLTRRDRMRFPMLIGRIALEHRFHVHPAGSFLQGSKP